jgi:hypothetical protein
MKIETKMNESKGSAQLKWRHDHKHARLLKRLLGSVHCLLPSFSFQDEIVLDFWSHLLFVESALEVAWSDAWKIYASADKYREPPGQDRI